MWPVPRLAQFYAKKTSLAGDRPTLLPRKGPPVTRLPYALDPSRLSKIAFPIDPDVVRDISGEALDESGRLRVLPAAFWAGTTAQERALFGHRHGLYSFPTKELVEHLRELIGGRPAIEIGAGHGVLAQALGITATDSLQHGKEPYRAMILAAGQQTVPYGPNVVECHASQAVRRFRPQVVVGCWVTHRYERDRHEHGGNEVGVDEPDILAHCDTYVLVGNEQVHAGKKIWDRRHTIDYPPWLYSRAMNPTREFIAVWRGRGGRKR